jgi:hypothetical protein
MCYIVGRIENSVWNACKLPTAPGRLFYEEQQMKFRDKSKVTVEMPSQVVEAAQKAAERDYTTISHLVRRVLVKELRESGLLQQEVA